MTQAMQEKFTILEEPQYRDMAAMILCAAAVEPPLSHGELHHRVMAEYTAVYPDDLQAVCRFRFVRGALELNGELA